MKRRELIVSDSGRVPCPVCGNTVWYFGALPGEDVTGSQVPVHSEGLIGSGLRCYASGMFGDEAISLGADVGRDPSLPLKAHP